MVVTKDRWYRGENILKWVGVKVSALAEVEPLAVVERFSFSFGFGLALGFSFFVVVFTFG